MPMFWGDYLADTLDLGAEEHGCYLLMLGMAWRRPDGALPNDLKLLKRILAGCCSDMHGNRFNKIVPRILERFWTLDSDGKWRQKRLGKEREKLEKRSGNARENARKRWGVANENNSLTDAVAMHARVIHNHIDSPPLSSPTQTTSVPEKRPPQGGNGHAEPNGFSKAQPESRGTRLPEDWEPGSEGIEYAKELGMTAEQIRTSYGAFMRHWLAKAGQAGRKLRWDLTWQTWVRNDHERIREKTERERQRAEAWQQQRR